MADPWKEENKPKQQKAPKFYLSIINFLLIVIVILIGLYLYKSYAFNKMKGETSDVQDSLAQKDKQIKDALEEADRQKANTAKASAQIPDLQKQISTLKTQIADMNQSYASVEEAQRAVKYACISSVECRGFFVNLTLSTFLAGKSLQSTLEGIEPGLDYNQFYLSPIETGNFTFAQLNFIKQNCANKWYEIPGLYVTRYSYRLTSDVNKRVQIVLNEKSADILCSWLIDDPTGSYTLVS